MENWGLVTYRESALLVDPKNSSASTKLWVALVVAHEIAHQWFGNLVTMQWWDNLWLNEGRYNHRLMSDLLQYSACFANVQVVIIVIIIRPVIRFCHFHAILEH